MGDHFVMSASSMDSRLGEVGLGSVREMVFMVVLGVVRRVVRICEPTAPVLPNTAAVGIVGWVGV